MNEKRVKRATLKDVAQAASVSSTAVSLVLNNKPNRFTEETRDHIRSIARDLNYVPNQSARSLATRASSLLALFIPDIENLFFVSLAKHLEDECKKQGYSMLIVDTSEDIREQDSALKRMIQLGIDGLFIVPARGSSEYNQRFYAQLLETDFPVVFIDRIPDELKNVDSAKAYKAKKKWSALAYDHEYGGRLAAQYFLDRGHQRMGIIGPVSSNDGGTHNNLERFNSFIEECNSRGVEIPEDCIRDGAFNVSVGRDNADELIDAGVTAVFCGNDLIAIGFTRRARERGIRVPEDISVIGYDDVMRAFGLDFAFTTIRQDVRDLARRSCEAMIDAMIGVLENAPAVGTHGQSGNHAASHSAGSSDSSGNSDSLGRGYVVRLIPELVEGITVSEAKGAREDKR